VLAVLLEHLPAALGVRGQTARVAVVEGVFLLVVLLAARGALAGQALNTLLLLVVLLVLVAAAGVAAALTQLLAEQAVQVPLRVIMAAAAVAAAVSARLHLEIQVMAAMALKALSLLFMKHHQQAVFSSCLHDLIRI
jgi:hypothetical protein